MIEYDRWLQPNGRPVGGVVGVQPALAKILTPHPPIGDVENDPH